MPHDLAIFLDDFAVCALLRGVQDADAVLPSLIMSSQVLLGRNSTHDLGSSVVCSLEDDPHHLQQRISAELGISLSCVGLAEALDAARNDENLLKRYLAVLLAACLRQAGPTVSVRHLILTLPFRAQAEVKAVRHALASVTPLFPLARWFLADAHAMSARAENSTFLTDEDGGRHSAVVALWRNSFSTQYWMGENAVNSFAHPTLLQIFALAGQNSAHLSLRVPVVKALTGRDRKTLLDIEPIAAPAPEPAPQNPPQMVPPQMPVSDKKLYRPGLIPDLTAGIRARYPATQDLGKKACPADKGVMQAQSYAIIGSLALHPAIRAGIEGDATGAALTQILRNGYEGTTTSLHPTDPVRAVMGPLKEALKACPQDEKSAAPGPPCHTITAESVTRTIRLAGSPVNTDTASGIHTLLLNGTGTSFPITLSTAQPTSATTADGAAAPALLDITVTVQCMESDKNVEATIEYQHLNDGSIALHARLNKRTLALKLAQDKEPKLELLESGGYRLTLSENHREQCKLLKELRHLITTGLHVFGSGTGMQTAAN